MAGIGIAAALARMGSMATATIRIPNIAVDAARKSDGNLCTSPTMCQVQLLLAAMSTMTSNTKVRPDLDFATRRNNGGWSWVLQFSGLNTYGADMYRICERD